MAAGGFALIDFPVWLSLRTFYHCFANLFDWKEVFVFTPVWGWYYLWSVCYSIGVFMPTFLLWNFLLCHIWLTQIKTNICTCQNSTTNRGKPHSISWNFSYLPCFLFICVYQASNLEPWLPFLCIWGSGIADHVWKLVTVTRDSCFMSAAKPPGEDNMFCMIPQFRILWAKLMSYWVVLQKSVWRWELKGLPLENLCWGKKHLATWTWPSNSSLLYWRRAWNLSTALFYYINLSPGWLHGSMFRSYVERQSKSKK